MKLTTEELTTLTERIEERMAEFGNLSKSMPKFTPGIVRLVYDAIDEWRSESAPPQIAAVSNNYAPVLIGIGAEHNGNGKHEEPEPPEYEAYDDEHEELVQWQPVTPSPQASATLGPEHVIVTPLKARPDPDIARGRLAQALANGSAEGRELEMLATRKIRTSNEAKRSNYLPTREELIAELKRQSMGGVMPSMVQFNESRPATWATADAHQKRLGISWGDLANEAGLKPQRSGRPVQG